MSRKYRSLLFLFAIVLLMGSANPVSSSRGINSSYSIEINLGSSPLIFQGEGPGIGQVTRSHPQETLTEMATQTSWWAHHTLGVLMVRVMVKPI